MTDRSFNIDIDFNKGRITSLTFCGEELAVPCSPLFRAALRCENGELQIIDATNGTCVAVSRITDNETRAEYSFSGGISVRIIVLKGKDTISWKAGITAPETLTPEWIEAPVASLKPLKGEGGEGQILYPYNEGAIIDSANQKESTGFRSWPIEYPSLGCYFMFPNMICSQFQAYISESGCLYMGAHDPDRGPKAILYSDPYFQTEEKGEPCVEMTIRTYCGSRPGEAYETSFPVVWKLFMGGWEDAAEIYREWFETELPPSVVKIKDNKELPEWYTKTPLVVSYPVRGIHDMDEMKPNALFPYTNALPLIEEIGEKTGTRIMALLMHWEGTAPWAPPYVWPPYGGEENFRLFRDALHSRGDLLGVYCSGFGYTIESNLANYSRDDTDHDEELKNGVCKGPNGSIQLSRICPGQRKGYDLCPASTAAGSILNEAYQPLFASDIDYAQILDQNHGGGQYLCYAKDHGHPPVPGVWMTASMQKLLSGWVSEAEGMLLGCESSAAEPFLGYLRLSDNRFELNWHIGRPVPLFSYIYHEYLRNFMGNQVSSAFFEESDTLYLRLAYSFAAGDLPTIVLLPDGRIMDHWGGRDFQHLPDREEVLSFIRKLVKFAGGEAGKYLARGRMIKPLPVDAPSHSYGGYPGDISVPDVFTAAFELEEGRVQILVNHTRSSVNLLFGGRRVEVPARDAAFVRLEPVD